MELLNTSEAAETLGVSVRRVRQLIDEGKLTAQKVGRDYAIQREALTSVEIYGKAGRPPKASADSIESSTATTRKLNTGKMRASNGISTGRKRSVKR